MKFKIAILSFVIPMFFEGSSPAEEKVASMVISATGYEMPAEKTSSDITVITKEEISHLPVHDLGGALNYVTGVAISPGGGPGTPSLVSIQGSEYRHVKIVIDGVPMETMVSAFPDLSLIPIESVESIELLKGSASSVWGSSLGGIINVRTRRPADAIHLNGEVSIGENSTRNYSAGLSGRVKETGYFLSASRFETDGFHDNQEADNNYFYAKITKEIAKGLEAEATYAYSDIDREDSGWMFEEETVDQHGTLMLTYTPMKELELNFSGYNRVRDSKMIEIATDIDRLRSKEHTYGGAINAVWRHASSATLSLGGEGSHGQLKSDESDYMGGYYKIDKGIDKRAVLANESVTLGRLTLNLGVRHDEDTVFGSDTSPSLGAVVDIGRSTFVRINAAKGFTTPDLTARYASYVVPNDLNAERAWTYQAGIETRAIPGLLGKVTFYRADVRDFLKWEMDSTDVDSDPNTWLIWKNIGRVHRRGADVELKTDEYKGLALSYGYAFNDVRDRETDQRVRGVATMTHNVGLDYRGPLETMTTFRGQYIDFNADPSSNAKDENFVWDLKISKYFVKWQSVIGEFFVSVHNITDEERHYYNVAPYHYKTPGRWVEAGVTLTTF